MRRQTDSVERAAKRLIDALRAACPWLIETAERLSAGSLDDPRYSVERVGEEVVVRAVITANGHIPRGILAEVIAGPRTGQRSAGIWVIHGSRYAYSWIGMGASSATTIGRVPMDDDEMTWWDRDWQIICSGNDGWIAPDYPALQSPGGCQSPGLERTILGDEEDTIRMSKPKRRRPASDGGCQ